MRRRRVARVFGPLALACFVGGASSWVGTAAAQDASPADVAAARQLGVQGVKLANAGNCAGAIDKLARAEKLYHAPTILGRLGECQVAVGKIVEGTENLQRVARETLPRSAPPAFVKARARAQRVLDASKGRIAHLHIAMTPPPQVDVSLTIDGEPLSTALVGADRPTDPGQHVVEAAAPGYLKATQSVTLQEGGEGTVTLELKPDPDAHPVVAAHPAEEEAKPPPPTPPPASPEHGPSRAPAAIALVVGGAGLVVGGVFGALAVSKKSSLDKSCDPTKICPATAQSDLDSAKSLATVSTIGFTVGAVGVVAGVVLLFVPSGPKKETSGSSRPSVSPYLSPTGAGLMGRF